MGIGRTQSGAAVTDQAAPGLRGAHRPGTRVRQDRQGCGDPVWGERPRGISHSRWCLSSGRGSFRSRDGVAGEAATVSGSLAPAGASGRCELGSGTVAVQPQASRSGTTNGVR